MSFRTEERIPEGLRVKVVVGASCDGCGVELEAVKGKWGEFLQTFSAAGALTLSMGGGYGMFFDDDTVHAVFCKQCATKLLEAFPGLKKAMDDQETW